MKSWIDTVRSLFIGRWWWFPSVFFAPWGLSAFLLFLIALALPFSVRTGGSNGVLLCATALTGVWAGLWARRLHGWECAVLVPDLPRRLLVLPVVLVAGATVVFAAFTIHAGNPFPAMGPALLVGVGAVYCLARLPEWAMPLASAVCVWLLLAWVVGGPVHLPALSHPAVQAPAVALAVAVLAILKRGLEAPVDEPPLVRGPGPNAHGNVLGHVRKGQAVVPVGALRIRPRHADPPACRPSIPAVLGRSPRSLVRIRWTALHFGHDHRVSIDLDEGQPVPGRVVDGRRPHSDATGLEPRWTDGPDRVVAPVRIFSRRGDGPGPAG